MRKKYSKIYYLLAMAMIMMITNIKSAGAQFVDLVPVETPYQKDADTVDQSLTQGNQSQVVKPVLPVPVLPNYLPESSKYTLGFNDVIEITVMRHPEVSGQYVINSEGRIQFEFIGDITASGKTKEELTKEIIDILNKYVISPEVTIKIVGYNSKVVYVIGEVASPGKIYMRGDTITVHEALVQAGLPLLSGKLARTRLITPTETGKIKEKMVNVDKLLYKGDLRENLVMSPGDTLYIPPTFLAKAMRVIQPVAAPIGTSAGTARTVTTGF